MDPREQQGGDAAETSRLRAQVAELQRLASHLSEAATKSHDREMTWVFALEGNQDGVWDWNVVTSEVFFSRRWKEMLGFRDDEITGSLSEWERRVHPDDLAQVHADLEAHLTGRTPFYSNEHRVLCKDNTWKWIHDRGRIVAWTADGRPLRVVGTHTDIDVRKRAEGERERLLEALQQANSRINLLTGILPICASCRQIRDDDGGWVPLERYVQQHSAAEFSHCVCPACVKRLYPEL